MLHLLKYLIQLILSPASGWDDLEHTAPDAEALTRRGLYPLMVLTAVTEFLAFFYQRHAALGEVVMRAVCDFGTYFVSLFIARLIFDLYLGWLCGTKPARERVACLTVCGIGLMVLVQLLCNCMPWNLVLFKFLPVYVILVLYKAIPYIGVRKADAMRFLGLSAAAIVAVPLIIYYLLYLLI